MDNKITKKRLSHFLSYEWIAIIGVIVAFVVIVEFLYSVFGVVLTTGQNFKIYYDQNVSYTNSDRLLTHLQNKNTFSFGVLEVNIEEAKEEFNVIGYRVSTYEGDVVITDDFLSNEEGATKYVRAKSLIDDISVYKLDELLFDAKEYLAGFLTSESGDIYNESDYSQKKIEDNFIKRAKGDNAYRKQSAIKEGIEKEKQRLFRLAKEIVDFEKILSLPDEYFFHYTKFEQAYTLTDETTDLSLKNRLKEGFEAESQRNNEQYGTNTARYGLRLDKFGQKEGKFNATEFFKRYEQTNSSNTMVLAFNFKEEQPDLQYEVIFFFNQIVRSFSDILD